MQLLVIRHGSAEEIAPGGDDADRSLTKSGKREMKDVADGLRTIIETLDVIGASQLLRPQQTAKIVAKAYGDLPVETLQALTPGSDPATLVEWLRQHPSATTAAIVGMQPVVGQGIT